MNAVIHLQPSPLTTHNHLCGLLATDTTQPTPCANFQDIDHRAASFLPNSWEQQTVWYPDIELGQVLTICDFQFWSLTGSYHHTPPFEKFRVVIAVLAYAGTKIQGLFAPLDPTRHDRPMTAVMIGSLSRG